MTNASLPELIAAAQQMSAEAQFTFGSLTAAQLNWKPNPEQWSVGQCFDHLLVSKEPYFKIIDEVVQGRKLSSWWEKLPLWPGFIARQMLKTLQPNSGRKVKAPKAFRPSSSNISADIVSKFVTMEQRWIDALKRTEGIDSGRVIITSPVAAVITYSLLDGMRLMAVHELRHFEQAKRVMETAGFPRS